MHSKKLAINKDLSRNNQYILNTLQWNIYIVLCCDLTAYLLLLVEHYWWFGAEL
jgi:hypothetical protein